jgi:hypothetical protein
VLKGEKEASHFKQSLWFTNVVMISGDYFGSNHIVSGCSLDKLDGTNHLKIELQFNGIRLCGTGLPSW